MLDCFTDIHIKAEDLAGTVVFPGPQRLPADYLPAVQGLMERCSAARQDEFTLHHHGQTWRGRCDRQTVDGLWYRLRSLPQAPPRLDILPSPLPRLVAEMLLSDRLMAGGLVYICGAAGSGKTTTASATVVSRLHTFGGVAYTIEDPPEMPLNGWHGEGYCSQTSVAGELANDWAESFRGALRSQPVATHQILFVGEIRNRESAQLLLRAAANGFLVIATGFGADVVSALDSLAKLSGEADTAMLGNMLRLVVHQRLRAGRLEATALASAGSSSAVAARIRSGQIIHLLGDLRQQEALMIRGQSPLEAE